MSGDSILEIQDHRIGAGFERLAEPFRSIARNDEIGNGDGHPAQLFRFGFEATPRSRRDTVGDELRGRLKREWLKREYYGLGIVARSLKMTPQ